jgi:hypothetical protein
MPAWEGTVHYCPGWQGSEALCTGRDGTNRVECGAVALEGGAHVAPAQPRHAARGEQRRGRGRAGPARQAQLPQLLAKHAPRLRSRNHEPWPQKSHDSEAQVVRQRGPRDAAAAIRVAASWATASVARRVWQNQLGRLTASTACLMRPSGAERCHTLTGGAPGRPGGSSSMSNDSPSISAICRP